MTDKKQKKSGKNITKKTNKTSKKISQSKLKTKPLSLSLPIKKSNTLKILDDKINNLSKMILKNDNKPIKKKSNTIDSKIERLEKLIEKASSRTYRPYRSYRIPKHLKYNNFAPKNKTEKLVRDVVYGNDDPSLRDAEAILSAMYFDDDKPLMIYEKQDK